MSRRKVFTDIVECVRWMLEKPGERWVEDSDGVTWKGMDNDGDLDVAHNASDAPFTAIRDEHGDIPEEVELPESVRAKISCNGLSSNWNDVLTALWAETVKLVEGKAK